MTWKAHSYLQSLTTRAVRLRWVVPDMTNYLQMEMLGFQNLPVNYRLIIGESVWNTSPIAPNGYVAIIAISVGVCVCVCVCVYGCVCACECVCAADGSRCSEICVFTIQMSACPASKEYGYYSMNWKHLQDLKLHCVIFSPI